MEPFVRSDEPDHGAERLCVICIAVRVGFSQAITQIQSDMRYSEVIKVDAPHRFVVFVERLIPPQRFCSFDAYYLPGLPLLCAAARRLLAAGQVAEPLRVGAAGEWRPRARGESASPGGRPSRVCGGGEAGRPQHQ